MLHVNLGITEDGCGMMAVCQAADGRVANVSLRRGMFNGKDLPETESERHIMLYLPIRRALAATLGMRNEDLELIIDAELVKNAPQAG